MTDVLVLGASTDVAQRILSVGGHDVQLVDRSETERRSQVVGVEALIWENSNRTPQVVVLGDDLPLAEALSLAERIDASVSGIDLMLVADPTTDLALRAMRVGIREILSPTIAQDDLKVLFHRAAENVVAPVAGQFAQDVAPLGMSRVIVVVSPKGGVGKSTVATNLAIGLGRTAPMQTVLVDLDLQFGDVATLLNLKPAHSIADAFGGTAALDTLILKTFLTPHPAGLYVLAGADSPTAGDNVKSAHVARLLEQLAGQFRFVVVDTGAGLSEPTLAALEHSNDVVMVSSMDVSSIRAVRKEVEVLNELSLLPSSRHMVVNMADRVSGLAVRDVEGVVGMRVNVVVPRSKDVPLAGNRGESILLAKKPGDAAKAINKLVERLLLDEMGGPADGQRAGKKGRRRGVQA